MVQPRWGKVSSAPPPRRDLPDWPSVCLPAHTLLKSPPRAFLNPGCNLKGSPLSEWSFLGRILVRGVTKPRILCQTWSGQ